MEQKLTIKQIADMAGVSVAAVSYALNGKKGISEDTRSRILDVINNTNYIPNLNSRRLILQRSFNILLVTNSDESPFNNFFYVEVINSIVENCTKLGYNTVLVKLSDKFELSGLKNTLLQHNADGIIFLCDISDELKKKIDEFKTPFVVVDSQKNKPTYPNVHANYKDAAHSAVKYLIENGHTKIAMLDSGNVSEYYMCTLEGYKKALSENNISFNPELTKSNMNDENSIESYVDKMLQNDNVPTAVFCSSDFVAINLMNILQRKGVKLPDDMSVCSIDDILLSRYHYPALTTIRIDKNLMGELAVSMLDKLINDEETLTSKAIPSCELVERDSVKKIK